MCLVIREKITIKDNKNIPWVYKGEMKTENPGIKNTPKRSKR